MISILGDLPVYSSFAVVTDPESPTTMMEERRNYYKAMLEKAEVLAREQGVRAQGSIVVGNEVRAVLHFLKEQNADLLVVGLHQHDFYLSRLWSSVYDLAQGATCSVLGVH
jgi:nucleotide-binding universal stress UspA family protein